MKDLRFRSDAASRHAVGALAGALVGVLVAAHRIFADYSLAGQVPWVSGLGSGVIGAVVGLVLAALMDEQTRPHPGPGVPPGVEGVARQHFHPAPEGPAVRLTPPPSAITSGPAADLCAPGTPTADRSAHRDGLRERPA